MKKIILLLTVIFMFLTSGCANKQQNNVDSTPEVKEEVTPIKEIKTEKGPNDKDPLVTIEMEDGSLIKVELYPEIAPNTVRNFVSLVQSGYYDGLIFHRVIPGFMIQGGDPEGTGMGGPGYTIAGEFSNNEFDNELKHERGVISMGRVGGQPDSAGSQFFIMVVDYSSLDREYASFGKVTEGIEIADKIVAVDTDKNDKPLEEQRIKKVTVDTFGVKYGEVEKVK